MLATVLHLHRGTPYVYQGEELGMTNAPWATIDDFRDIESLNHYARGGRGAASRPDDVLRALRTMGRDNARTPVQWTPGPHAGFTTGEPWLPVNPNHTEINAEAERANPDSVFHHYRRVIELRHALPVDRRRRLHDAAARTTSASTRTCARWTASSCSCSATSAATRSTVTLPGWDDAEAVIGAPGLTLGPWEGKALVRGGSGR